MQWRGPITRLRRWRWHQWARLTAFLIILDQLSPPPDLLPVSEGIIVACIAALFAPVPVEKRDKD